MYFNERLFESQLPLPLFTLQRKKGASGYHSPARFKKIKGKETADEIALNPNYFVQRGDMENMQTLVHEMCHQWQFLFGKPSRSGYHNQEWAKKMEAVGLMPSATGRPGGKKTGQHMSDYAIEGGAFLNMFKQWKKMNMPIEWASIEAFFPQIPQIKLAVGQPTNQATNRDRGKVKFSCCKQNIWGKESIKVVCGICGKPMKPVS